MKTNPCIAILVSNDYLYCRDFIRHYQLNPNLFKMITDIDRLKGIDPKTPIIIVHHNFNERFMEMKEFIDIRFTSVRHMDY